MSFYMIVKGVYAGQEKKYLCHFIDELDLELRESFHEKFKITLRTNEILENNLRLYQIPMCKVLNFFGKNGYRVVSSTYTKEYVNKNESQPGIIWTLEKRI
ncbi:hypothetical protein KQX54_010143 [Cotesia glomerata]|uniref:Uncharacterized protein n=1 Tax=Cotesia glomerata TaxID=32391 RepID=A0AAV7J458_COTGL|nr:hypothetical protein KQX54_010143 [Cotesia glomerata]